ncbi:hypothetical protein [Microbacterium sp. 22296]|uniref:hypothetical protein n=1 Tax=Microbacterium sp. 22296 TaxID=3453903 RepID=UPI003F828F14
MRAGVVAVASVAALGIIGTIVASSIAAQNASNWAVLRDRSAEQATTISQLESSVTRAESDRDRAVGNLVPQAELTEREQTVAAAEGAIADREAAVKGREDAITAKEQFVRQTSLADGTYTVGVSMEAGTYRTQNSNSSCYWAIYVSGTNYDDIESNDLGSTGVLTVTVGDGQDFQTKRCGTWTKVG